MSQILGVAVLGLGEIAASRHLPVLTAHPYFKVTWAGELDAERAQQVGRAFSIPKVSADVRSVIASDEVKVVAILTPPATHAELAHLALDAGKHVLVEKPLTLDVTQGQELAAHAERAATKFLTGLNQRHHFYIQRARAMIRAGKLGKVNAVSTVWGYGARRGQVSAWRVSPGQGGDVLFDLGVHHFDTVRFLLDADVKEISVMEGQTAESRAATTAEMKMSNGVPVTTALVEDGDTRNVFEIRGELGTLFLSLYPFNGFRFIPRNADPRNPGLRMRRLADMLMQLPRRRRGGEYASSYRAEWDHFYEVIQKDVPPIATARDGLEATRIANAARESLKHGKVVVLNSLEPNFTRS